MKQISVAVQVSEVAGSEPAVPKGGLRRGDVIVVSPRDGRASQRDLSTFAGGQLSALAVHDRDLGSGGLADRTGLPSFQRVRGNLGRGFRHAVGLDHGNAKQRFQLVKHVGRQRRRGRTDNSQG